MGTHIAKHIKVVLFDHDDTLVGTKDTKWAQHKFTAKKYYGKELTDEEIKLHWGKPLEELICILYSTTDADQAMMHLKRHHLEFPKDLFAETIPTLTQLKAKGFLTGVITASNRYSFEHDLNLHHIASMLLDYTQTSDDTKFHKPDSRVFEPVIAWLTKQHIHPSEVIYVGDGLHDMKAALGAGFQFIGVQTGLVTAKEFQQNGAKSVVNIAHLL